MLGFLCDTCKKDYEKPALRKLTLKTLCSVCSSKVLSGKEKQDWEKFTWSLGTINRCPNAQALSHQKAGIEEGTDLVPASWYRNNPVKDLSLEQIFPGLLKRRTAFLARKSE